MTNGTPENEEPVALLKVLTAHYHSLVSARSDQTLLRQYASLLRGLRSKPSHFLDASAEAKIVRPARPRVPTISDEEIQKVSLDDLEKLVTDLKTPRIDLEFVAVRRFSVPQGSLRSFANRTMLVDKLRTLIANERAHETIGSVARDQAKRT